MRLNFIYDKLICNVIPLIVLRVGVYKLGLYNHIYSVSLLDFFVKLKDGYYKERLGI